MIDTAFKYGNLEDRMVVLLYELMEEFRLKPNATIITYLLNSLSNDKSQLAIC